MKSEEIRHRESERQHSNKDRSCVIQRREFLELLAKIGGASALAFVGRGDAFAVPDTVHASLKHRRNSNRIVLENRRLGTKEWILQTPPAITASYPPGDIDRVTNRCPVIEGYAWPISVNAGEVISFYVSTTSDSYSLKVFRMGYYGGLGGRATGAAWSALTVGGCNDPQPSPADNGDASSWKPTVLSGGDASFIVPKDWVSGCYIAKLEASSGKQSYIFFVVRDDFRGSELLMQCSVTTYHAYNGWNGDSVYAYNNPDYQWRNNGETIWLKRPFLPSSCPAGRYGAGAGAFFTYDKGPGGPATWDPPRPEADVYSSSGWEYSMVRWLEMEGYDVSYCTNLDTDRNQLSRSPHRVFLSVGHDEYWSLEAYQNVANARDNGVSLLWFSGNTVWNCVDLSQDGQMRVVGNFNPANAGSSNPPLPVTDYGLIGGTWVGGSPVQEDFRVQASCLWATEGVSLKRGGFLGNLIGGYEVNGLDPNHPEWDVLLPPGMEVLLTAPRNAAGQSIWYTSRESGATVVSLGTVQWSWGVDDLTLETDATGSPPPNTRNRVDQGVQQFTRNLITHCTDAKYMVADLPDGIYQIESVSASPQVLIVSDNGEANGPVVIYGGGNWHSSNNQALWFVERYAGPHDLRPAIIGPYKAASDVWYTIRNAQNGQHLIVGDSGSQNGTVEVYGYPASDWGRYPNNTQMMWRIWRYERYTSADPVYLIQNICCGQLLIVGENGRKDGPVWVFGNYNGGWGEAEDNTQKLWQFSTPPPECLRCL